MKTTNLTDPFRNPASIHRGAGRNSGQALGRGGIDPKSFANDGLEVRKL